MKLICYTKDPLILNRCRSLSCISDFEPGRDIDRLLDSFSDSAIAVVDLRWYKLDGLETCPGPLVALAELPSFQEAMQLLQKGIRGYGNRIMRTENLEQAIASVVAGQMWLPPDIIGNLITTVGNGDVGIGQTGRHTETTHILGQLSEREQEVALCVADGMSNKEIAEKLFVSLRTVKAHLSSIYDKTGLRNRLELGVKLKAAQG